MTTPVQTDPSETPLGRDILHAVRYYLCSRRGLMIAAGIAVSAGLAFNWTWLVAAGIAPVLISLLPCIAMCAVGVCCLNRARGGGKSDPDGGSDGPEGKS